MNEDNKKDFQGNRDFYNIIKSVTLDCSKLVTLDGSKLNKY